MQLSQIQTTTKQLLIGLSLIAGGLCGGWWIRTFTFSQHVTDSAPQQHEHIGETRKADSALSPTAATPSSTPIEFSRDSWQAASIELGQVKNSPFHETIKLTGKVALNEDRVAHIFPLVDGRVNEVRIHFGDKVKRGDLLVVVQSKEVGQTMLQLFQDRQQRDFALTKDRWTQTVSENTQAMIKLIRDGASIDDIEKQLTNRPIGEHRDQLMTAYIAHYKSKRNLDRLEPLSQQGGVTGKQLLDAEAEWNASRATMQSLVEQIQQDALQSSIISTQSVKELQTRISVDETNLKILGFQGKDLETIDPAKQGETLAHYPIHSPFDGTIISKDVVLLEHVGPDRQILSIADLSTVWVTADIYEEHLPLLKRLEGQEIQLSTNAWPNEKFPARIFYTGDVVDETTRTISMRAQAQNQAGSLKPGMFVEVEFPSQTSANVLQVPLSAVLEHEGQAFVFVHTTGDQFERRDITMGRRNSDMVEIQSGLKGGESIAMKGGFALKSRMLAELLSE